LTPISFGSFINPFDYDNWRNLDFSNDQPYIESKMGNGGDIDGKQYYVAVSETKDGYWYIMSRPTHEKWVAESMLKGSVPKNEIGKVVTLEEARNHRKVVGEQYLTDDMIARISNYAQGGELHRSQMN
jgi:hypothetical protein